MPLDSTLYRWRERHTILNFHTRKEVKMTRTILGLTLALAITSTALAHNGRTGYIPAWPDPSTFVLDGEEDD